MAVKRCHECGVQLEVDAESCPLCGADTARPRRSSSPEDVDTYQSNVRMLREQLKRMRDDAEAV